MLLVQTAGAEEGSAPPPDVYLISRGEAAEAQALALARGWRRQGLAVELDLSGAAYGKQFKRADRSGARWAAVVGDAEAAEGVVILRDLRGATTEAGPASGEQRLAPAAVPGVVGADGLGG